jgi:hypothetical protein
MAVGRRAAVGTKRVQPVAAPLDGDKAASADAAHAAALRLLTTRVRTRRTCLGLPGGDTAGEPRPAGPPARARPPPPTTTTGGILLRAVPDCPIPRTSHVSARSPGVC